MAVVYSKHGVIVRVSDGSGTITKNTKLIPITNTGLWSISNINKINIDNSGNLNLVADTGTARYYAVLNTAYNFSNVKRIRIKYHFDYADYDDIIDISTVSPLYPYIRIGYLTDAKHNELYIAFTGESGITYTIRSSNRGHDANSISYLELLV